MAKRQEQAYLDAFDSISAAESAVLSAVHEHVVDHGRDAFVLDFGRNCLILTADAEDDTIAVSAQCPDTNQRRGLRLVTGELPWSQFVGRTFAWGWITRNQQGYCDGVLLSFDTIEPVLLVQAIASNLRVYRVSDAGTLKHELDNSLTDVFSKVRRRKA